MPRAKVRTRRSCQTELHVPPGGRVRSRTASSGAKNITTSTTGHRLPCLKVYASNSSGQPRCCTRRPKPNSKTRVMHSQKKPSRKACGVLSGPNQRIKASDTTTIQTESRMPLTTSASGVPNFGSSTASRNPPLSTAQTRIRSQIAVALNINISGRL